MSLRLLERASQGVAWIARFGASRSSQYPADHGPATTTRIKTSKQQTMTRMAELQANLIEIERARLFFLPLPAEVEELAEGREDDESERCDTGVAAEEEPLADSLRFF